MVLDFIGGIASGSLRGLARNLFPGFYERGISANQALDELREAGLGYRRQDFLRDFREGQGIYEQAVKVRFVNLDKTPSEGILEPLYHGVSDKYSFVFRADVEDLNTGETGEQYFFYHRNTIQTRSEMEDEAGDWLEGQSDRYNYGVLGVSISEGYINPVWG